MKMRVTISSLGRFWAFRLALQLLKRGHLQRLISGYPRYLTSRYGIPRDKAVPVVLPHVFERLWRRYLPSFITRSYDPTFLIHDTYDMMASRHVYGRSDRRSSDSMRSDIFVGWASYSLRSIKVAKRIGTVTVLERASSHMLHQRRLIKEEFDAFGIPYPKVAHSKIVEKELAEYEEVDYIAVPSLFVKRTFLEKGVPESKIIHVPFGADLSAFRQIPKEDNVFRVVFTGGMSLQKGTHYLLQAFSELKLPHAELMLIGSMNEEMKPFFQKYAGSFRFVGHVSQPELYRYYSQGSVFVLPSIQEGFGMVFMEAMACGLSVIATENTGGPDVIREGVEGFIVPIRSVQALKEKLLYLYEHPDVCERMGVAAKERVKSGFTWDYYGERMCCEYERVLKERRG